MKWLSLLGMGAIALAATWACGSSDDGGGGATTPPGDDGGGGADAPPMRAAFGLDTRPPNASCKVPARPPSTAPVKFQQVFTSLSLPTPMMLAQIPGDGTRWFAALRDGRLVQFPVNNPTSFTEVANIGTLAAATIDTDVEGGFLGFAIHPKFSQNGRVYVTWTSRAASSPSGMRSRVGVITSPNKDGASFTTYADVLTPFDQPFQNHNGGGIAFGKDGYLYLSFGDGGDADDTAHHGQNPNTFFSKILRIDVDSASPYAIPDGNPFKNGGGEPATFAMGFRNPFRFSIDRESNEVWVADVGQNTYEEVDRVKAGGNYGWPCREGQHDWIPTSSDATKCPSMNGLLDPVFELKHPTPNSRSITGGFVYRGKAIPGFVGTYVFGDYVQQKLYSLSFDPSTGAATSSVLSDPDPVGPWGSFAEDQDGELYAVSLGGPIFQIAAQSGGPTSAFPDRLSKTGCVDPTDAKKPAAGLIPYRVNAALWSDGAEKSRFMALPDGATITVKDDGDFEYPIGTVMMKTFVVGGKRIETRLFMRHDDGGWAGYSYEWLDDETDAVLLPSSKTKAVGAQTWTYPSRSDCISCHTQAAGRTLGPELGQLNGDFTYGDRISNQLATLDHIGMFDTPLGAIDSIVAYPDPYGTAPADQRARAYLHANCSQCHRPDGPGAGNMDLRYGQSFADTKTCNVDPTAGDLGVSGAKLIVPGAPEKSLVSLRPHQTVSNRMPPLATVVVDDKGTAAIDDFIRGLAACP